MYLRSILLALSLACAPTVFAKKPIAPTPQLAATHGYVYVNFPYGSAAPLSIASTAGGKPIELIARPDRHRAAWGAWVPAGTYRMVRWGENAWRDTSSFEVQPGRITDLGGLLGVGIGGYQIVFVPTHHPDNAGDVQMAVDEFQSVLASREPLRWSPQAKMQPITIGQRAYGLGPVVDVLISIERSKNKTPIAEQLQAATTNAEFLRLARSITPPLYDEPAIAPDGTTWYGAALGQLRKRTPEGEWSSVGIDTFRSITSVEYDDGALVAGSDMGDVWRSADGGATWSVLKAMAPGEAVMDIDHDGSQWLITGTRFAPDGDEKDFTQLLSVYRATSADLHDLQRVHEVRLPFSEQLGWLGARGQLVNDDYTVTAGQSLLRLDTKTMAWKTITPPSSKVNGHRVDPATGIITALFAKGMFSKLWISQDRGDTWKQIGRPPYAIFDVQMDTPATGWALRLNMDAFSSRWTIYGYDPAIDDWKVVGEAPHLCKPLRATPALPVLCISQDASILRREGTRWIPEFSVQ